MELFQPILWSDSSSTSFYCFRTKNATFSEFSLETVASVDIQKFYLVYSSWVTCRWCFDCISTSPILDYFDSWIVKNSMGYHKACLGKLLIQLVYIGFSCLGCWCRCFYYRAFGSALHYRLVGTPSQFSTFDVWVGGRLLTAERQHVSLRKTFPGYFRLTFEEADML